MFVARWVFVILASAAAVAASPELRTVHPTGAQRGTTVRFTLSGARLGDAAAVLFYKPGIEVSQLTVENAETVRIDCVIAADCPLGEHPLRLRTASGVTELRTVWIGPLPVVAETEPNDDFAAPQAVALNSTIAGVVQNEDVDYFAVELKAGQRLTAEFEAMRLGRSMTDLYVALLDSRRFELATCDDSALLLQDGYVSAIAPADGTYIVQIREASYGGGGDAHYRLHIGDFPRPAAAFPPGAQPGETVAFQCLGDAAGPIERTVAAPAAAPALWPLFVHDERGIAPSPLPVRVSPLAELIESADLAAAAPPVAFNGVLSAAGETDSFRFNATAGQVFDIHVYARRLRSPLDPVLDLFNSEGGHLAGNDDSIGPDSYLRFTAPADGQFELRVRDHLGHGGPLFVYCVEVDQVRPSFSLTLDRRDTQRPQLLQTVCVPRGNRYAALLRCDRRDVGGPVTLESPSLPAGVSLATDTLAADLAQLPVVFEAAADAPLAGELVALRGRIPLEGGDVVGGFVQEVPLVFGPPNQTVYYSTSVDRLAVAVTDAAPIRVTLVPPAGPLLQNGSMQLLAQIERAEGFAGEVSLHMLWNPPGVSSAPAVVVPGEQASAAFPLNAAGNAAVRSSRIALIARADAGAGDVWVSSQLVELSVSQPYLAGEIQLAATQQGSPASVLCKLTPVRPFEGKAQVALLGLPPKTSASPVEIAAGATEIVFQVACEPDAPVGKHGGLFCELTATENGAPVNHRFAFNGVLRIDPPPPAEVAAQPQPAPPPAAAAQAPPPPKPLSRLEQLRREAAERATGREDSSGDSPKR